MSGKPDTADWLLAAFRGLVWLPATENDKINGALRLWSAMRHCHLRGFLDADGWRRLLDGIEPAKPQEQEDGAWVRRRFQHRLWELSLLDPKGEEVNTEDFPYLLDGAGQSILNECGKLDMLETAKHLAHVDRIVFENARRPMSQQDLSGIEYVRSIRKNLPMPPQPRDPRAGIGPDDDSIRMYCEQMNAVPNSIGLRSLREPHFSPMSFAMKTCREITRGLAAYGCFTSSNGSRPSSWDDMVSAGLLEAPPYDFLGEGPLNYDPETGKIFISPQVAPESEWLHTNVVVGRRDWGGTLEPTAPSGPDQAVP